MELSLIMEEFIINYGLISIFLIVALEYANAPLPSELVLPLAGIMAVEYNMNLITVIIASILGGILGSITNYYLGYKLGNPLLYKLKDKYPKTKKAIKESYRWMEKYDKVSVMLSRLLPLARTFISIVAGVTRMNLVVFTVYSTIGISVWNTILITIGYMVGDNMNLITQILKKYSMGIVIILVAFFIIRSIVHIKKHRTSGDKQEIESEY